MNLSASTRVVSVTILLLWSSHVHAYLDPATGSILLQGLLAGFAGLMVVLRLHWSKVKTFFRRLRGKPAEESLDKAAARHPPTPDRPEA